MEQEDLVSQRDDLEALLSAESDPARTIVNKGLIKSQDYVRHATSQLRNDFCRLSAKAIDAVYKDVNFILK